MCVDSGFQKASYLKAVGDTVEVEKKLKSDNEVNLMEETWETTPEENIKPRKLEIRNQQFGARVYSIYCFVFGVLMTLSFLDFLPGSNQSLLVFILEFL